MEIRHWLSPQIVVLRVALLVIVAVLTTPWTSKAAEVTFLHLGHQTLEYVVTIDEVNRASGTQLLAAALGLIIAVPPADIKIDVGGPDRSDFVVDLTTSEKARIEMTAVLGNVEAATALSYTTFDSRTRKYAVRLLWDRIGKMKNNHGFLIEHPNALARLVSSLAREVYGTLKMFNEDRARRSNGAPDAFVVRDSYLASAKTLSRIIAHKKFVILAPQDQKDFRDAASAEFKSALNWQEIAESRRTSQAERVGALDAVPTAKVFLFTSRCEKMFLNAR